MPEVQQQPPAVDYVEFRVDCKGGRADQGRQGLEGPPGSAGANERGDPTGVLPSLAGLVRFFAQVSDQSLGVSPDSLPAGTRKAPDALVPGGERSRMGRGPGQSADKQKLAVDGSQFSARNRRNLQPISRRFRVVRG